MAKTLAILIAVFLTVMNITLFLEKETQETSNQGSKRLLMVVLYYICRDINVCPKPLRRPKWFRVFTEALFTKFWIEVVICHVFNPIETKIIHEGFVRFVKEYRRLKPFVKKPPVLVFVYNYLDHFFTRKTTPTYVKMAFVVYLIFLAAHMTKTFRFRYLFKYGVRHFVKHVFRRIWRGIKHTIRF